MIDQAIACLAASQYGLITRAQAVAAGATNSFVAHRIATGRWIRVGPGVYRLAGAPVTWRQRAFAACLVAGAPVAVSHKSAAVLHQVSGFRPGRIEITVPRGRGDRNPLAVVHRSLWLPPADWTVRNGIPVTRPARTIADLAARVGASLLEEAVDDVLCRRLVSLGELTSKIDELGPRRGVHALRTILEAWNPEALPAGVAEMRVVRCLLAHGLPDPVRQHEIFDADGRFIARVDLAYPEARVAIELDSFRWHAGRRPFRSDRVRGNRITAAGWRLLRATPDDVDDGGAELAAAVGAVLLQAA